MTDIFAVFQMVGADKPVGTPRLFTDVDEAHLYAHHQAISFVRVGVFPCTLSLDGKPVLYWTRGGVQLREQDGVVRPVQVVQVDTGRSVVWHWFDDVLDALPAEDGD
jgi:hypothetical protein